MYQDADYAISRLHETIVLFGDTAVKVRCVEDDLDCTVKEVLTGKSHIVPLAELNVTDLPLGFCMNPETGSLKYIVRKPLRRDWRQGLRRSNCQDLLGRGIDSYDIARSLEADSVVKYSQGIKSGSSTLVISRDFALKVRRGGGYNIQYKWYGKVGSIKDGVITLEQKSEYLRRELEELCQL
jgi:hypothetical protein